MIKNKKIIMLCLVVTALSTVIASTSSAVLPHVRDGWLIGMSFGLGYGEVTFANDLVGDTVDGVTPQIRFGHMLGKNYSATVEYNGWMYETGQLPDKYRISLQGVMAALTWYPGNPESAFGGMFVRAGCGLGWTGLAAVQLDEDLIQEYGIRKDESGLALGFAFGYEMRIVENLAGGMAVGVNYLDIWKDIFEKAYIIPLTLSLTWYWD